MSHAQENILCGSPHYIIMVAPSQWQLLMRHPNAPGVHLLGKGVEDTSVNCWPQYCLPYSFEALLCRLK